MKRTLVILLIIPLVISGLLSLLMGGMGETTDTLYDDKNKSLSGGPITLPGGAGLDASYYFKVGRNVPISEASFNISTHEPQYGNILLKPYVDVGLDSEVEWKYEGVGYGRFGEQKAFSDDLTRKSVTFTSPGSNSNSKALLPAGAEIIEASLGVRGRFRTQSISEYQIERDPSSITLSGYVVESGDIDGDKDQDLIVSDTRNSRILWLQNPGNLSLQWPSYTIISGSYATNCYSLDVGDIDGDGDIDIAATSYSYGYVYWLRNDNKGMTWVRFLFYSSFTYAGRIRIADMDNDGNPDLVVHAYYSYYYYYRYLYIFEAPDNPSTNYSTSGGGTSSYWRYYSVYSSYFYYYYYTYLGMDVGDMDGDGFQDIVISVYYPYSWPSLNHIYRFINPQSLSGTWSYSAVDTSISQVHSVEIADIDGDKNNDILAASYGSNILVSYTNSATNPGYSWTKNTIASFTRPTYLLAKDLNGDNKTDFAVGGGEGVFEFATFYQGSSPTTWKKNTATTILMDPRAFTIVDVDKDSDLDFVVAGASGSQLAIIETTSKTAPAYSMIWIEDGGIKDIRAMDYMDADQDGDTDIFFVAYGTGWIGWWENDGTPFDTAGKVYRIGAISSPIKVMCSDADGDLDKDVIALSGGGVLMWWENTQNPKSPWTSRIIATGISSPYGMYAGDFTGDRKADVVVSSNLGYSGCYIRIFKCPNDPRTSPNQWTSNYIATGLNYLKNVWADDMNLDGDLDVLAVYGNYANGVAIIYNNPLGTKDPLSGTWSGTSIDSNLYYPEDIKSIDITDDGYPDVIASSSYYYSKLQWYHNPEGDQVNNWVEHVLWNNQFTWNIGVGDIGGDGYADVIFNYGSYSGPSAVYWLEEPVDYNSDWPATFLKSHSGTWAVGIADLEGDSVDDLISTSRSSNEIRAWKINAQFPSQIGLDIGADEVVPDWSVPDMLKGRRTVDIKDALQEVIDTVPSSVILQADKYGTDMLTIPMEISSGTTGRVQIEDIYILYNASVMVKQNSNGKPLSKVLDRLIPDYGSDDEPYVRIYIGVGAETQGMAFISDLRVEYNAIPKQVKPLPRISLKEDTSMIFDFELDEYFRDDYTPSEELKFAIGVSGPSAQKIEAKLIGKKIAIDSTKTPNFYSRGSEPYDIYGRIHVTDNGGPNNVPARTFITKDFPIIIEPTNDRPVRTGAVLPTLTAYEGSTSILADLDDYELFRDIDGDPLRYRAVPSFPANYNQTAGFSIIWKSATNELEASLSDLSDWTGTIPVRLFTTDLVDFNTNSDPYIDFLVDVKNINDGPYWAGKVPIFTTLEDTTNERVADLSQFVIDIDTPRSELDYMIESQNNKSYIFTSLEVLQNGQVYLGIEPKVENWFGSVSMEISVSDGEYSDVREFKVDILPVNDMPSLAINEPIEDGRVESGKLSIVGEAWDVEGILFVEVLYDGTWVRASGTNSWGVYVMIPKLERYRENVPIQARTFDGSEYAYAYVNITIAEYREIVDPDLDDDLYPNSVDKFPLDPSEWSDRDYDGIGDNTDEFPDNKDWSRDSDKDGKADQADTHPFDPTRWNDKDNDGRDDDLPPLIGGPGKEDSGKDWTVPILLYVLASISLVMVLLSGTMYFRKRMASKDPRLMAKYYARQQRWRTYRHDMIEKLPLASSLLGGDSTGRKAAKPAHGPAIARPFGPPSFPGRTAMPLPSRPSPALPPAQSAQQYPASMQNLTGHHK